MRLFPLPLFVLLSAVYYASAQSEPAMVASLQCLYNSWGAFLLRLSFFIQQSLLLFFVSPLLFSFERTAFVAYFLYNQEWRPASVVLFGEERPKPPFDLALCAFTQVAKTG
jgi:hypothetical protein